MTKWSSIFLVFLILGYVNAQDPPKKAVLIRAGFVYNSEKNSFEKNQEILIVDGKIADIGSKVSTTAGTKIIDMSKNTVTPGLVDAHTHLLLSLPYNAGPDPMVVDPLVHSGTERVLRGAAIAKTYLNAGFTTVRDLGNSGMFLDVTLKNAIEKGYIEGPRMFVSGPILSAVGGQFEKLSHHLSHLPGKEYRIIKGVDDARQAVMEHLNSGADVIKICSDNSPNIFLLTIEEIKAITETAHQYGKKVTAHATFDKSIQNAILAGVDGIEHGYGISDSSLTLMAQRNVYWVPTPVSFQEGMMRVKRQSGLTGKDAEAIVNEFVQPNKAAIQSAMKKGVKIVVGSDSYNDTGQPIGDQAKDVLVALREAGASVADVLRFATYNSSQILNRQGVIGTLKKGAQADICVFDGNLEQGFAKSLFQVRLVLKGGNIVFKSENE
ncbi:Xaa-Pro dipeptidase [Dyadobacter beijingensis]|uniref:Xaa-Pro dipeptidase n=1 Tax=Dyadobacter beijingensis TaxID=365489 RepID=A0ABQ2IJI9_9BACT|nr:amidohydrolase family protein [Dyadobacter beijingensis]GGN10018.1 Xaa-Pro dipeptidase [Dyadobacter beijingensis]